MKIFNLTCNGKTIKLTDSNYVTAGGEGAVYKKDFLIYKIYHSGMDSQKEQKLKFLSILQKDNIIAPKDILYSASNTPVGYTMKLVDDASTLALLFTKQFKIRNKITDSNIEKLFLNMSETIQYIHEKQILIVDGNELNYLISNKDFSTPYFIDVDSYQTKDFPATAIMPSIQDFCTRGFNSETDWYSFAVLMFQLYVGIHPYKGTHPKYNIRKDNGKEIKFDNIPDRCKNHVSVFNKDVRYPPFIDLNAIPSNLHDWFYDVFENGKRLAPPTVVTQMISKPQITKIVSVGLNQTLYQEYDSPIQKVVFINGGLLVATESGYHYQNLTYPKAYKKELPLFYEKDGNIHLLHITKVDNDLLISEDMKETKQSYIDFKAIMYSNNRVFIITGDNLLELEKNNFSSNLLVSASYNIMGSASKFFVNCMYMNSFGNAIFYIPERKDLAKVTYISKVSQLNSHILLDAFYSNGTLFTISQFDKKYYRTVVKYDSHFINYSYIQEECNLQEVNATVLSNGMSLVFNEDELELSSKFSTDRKVINAFADVQLANNGSIVLGFKDNKLFNLSMKP